MSALAEERILSAPATIADVLDPDAARARIAAARQAVEDRAAQEEADAADALVRCIDLTADLESLYAEALDRLPALLDAVDAVTSARFEYEQAWSRAQKTGNAVPLRVPKLAERSANDPDIRHLTTRLRQVAAAAW
ncbi:MAG TPA: hypothetical protein VFB25_10820 [Gaiellaceae bacterium]|nr:hypothetical protein [Gaiellaceae bacterium]